MNLGISDAAESRASARRVLASFLVVFLTVLPLTPCFANCCCDGDQAASSAVAQADDRSVGHCHESAVDHHAPDTEDSSHQTESMPPSCGELSSSCPCPEIPPVVTVAENSGTKDTLTKLEIASERVSDGIREDGQLRRVLDPPSRWLHAAREPLFLRLAVFRI